MDKGKQVMRETRLMVYELSRKLDMPPKSVALWVRLELLNKEHMARMTGLFLSDPQRRDTHRQTLIDFKLNEFREKVLKQKGGVKHG